MANINDYGLCYRAKYGGSLSAVDGDGTFTGISTAVTDDMWHAMMGTSPYTSANEVFIFILYGNYGQYSAREVVPSHASTTVEAVVGDEWDGDNGTYTFYYSTGGSTGSRNLGERISFTLETSVQMDTVPMPESLPKDTLAYDVEGYMSKITAEGFYLQTTTAYDNGNIYYIESYMCGGQNYANYAGFIWWDGEVSAGAARAYPVVLENARWTNGLSEKLSGNKFVTRYSLNFIVRDPVPY